MARRGPERSEVRDWARVPPLLRSAHLPRWDTAAHDCLLRRAAGVQPGDGQGGVDPVEVRVRRVEGRRAHCLRVADHGRGGGQRIDLAQRATFARYDLDPAAFDVLATLRRSGAPFTLSAC